jgi:hypothetical protein
MNSLSHVATVQDHDEAERTRIVSAARASALARSSTADAVEAPHAVVEERVAAVSPFDPRAEPDEVQPLDRAMFERLFAKDAKGALLSAEAILRIDPKHKSALRAYRNCRVLLEAEYRDALGSEVPIARVGVEQLVQVAADCGTAFAFALKAGAGDLASLLEMSAMPQFETLALLYEMLGLGIVEHAHSA